MFPRHPSRLILLDVSAMSNLRLVKRVLAGLLREIRQVRWTAVTAFKQVGLSTVHSPK